MDILEKEGDEFVIETYISDNSISLNQFKFLSNSMIYFYDQYNRTFSETYRMKRQTKILNEIFEDSNFRIFLSKNIIIKDLGKKMKKHKKHKKIMFLKKKYMKLKILLIKDVNISDWILKTKEKILLIQ